MRRKIFRSMLLVGLSVLLLSAVFFSLILTDRSLLTAGSKLLPAVLLILVLTVLLAYLLSGRLSRSIIRPILELDLPHSHNAVVYEELKPLLQRLQRQSETIRTQLDTLNQRSEEFTAITENMTEGFLLTDSRGTLLSCNSSALHLLGSGAPRPGELILSDAVAEPFRHVVTEALAGRHSEATMEQDERTYRLLANCVRRGTRTAGAVVAVLDVTEQESREKLRREFTANVSHELKTPLTSISGFAELMKNGLVAPETVPEFAGDIYREAQRLISLVEDIIHLSRLDEGSLPLEQTRVDLHLLSGDIFERLAPAAKEADISLHLHGTPLFVTGVPSVLDEMIYNLVENAIKYNRPGGSVTVTTLLTTDGPRLLVSDTGIGIPSAHQSRVFERFYRVDKSHSKEVGGTGLGLSIVKHAAAYHGAALSLESREGEGTTVTIQWK